GVAQGARREREGRAPDRQHQDFAAAADGVLGDPIDPGIVSGIERCPRNRGPSWSGSRVIMNADLIPNSIVEVGTARFGNRLPLTLIAGPCALESRAHALEMAQALKEIAARLKIGLVYKTSFDKANRTSSNS